MSNLPNKTALITGASSGIGEAFAEELASRGYQLILVARREDRLQQMAEQLSERYGNHVQLLAADLSDEDDMSRVEVFLRDGEGVDLLVNNAGFGMVGAFATIELTEHLRMLQLHVIASMRLAHAALPAMLERGTGGIINVSSVAGFVQGGNITYHTTKSFLIEFSQSLNREVAWKGVRVQALCPGYTRTEFHDPPELSAIRRSRLPGFMWLDAENVVKESLKALDQNQVICVPGMAYKIIVFLVRSPLLATLVNLVAVRMRRRVA